MVSRRDTTLQRGLGKIREIDADNNKDIRAYYTPTCEETKKGRASILYVLNHYENVAVAIHNNIFADKICKRAECTIIVNIVERCRHFIKMAQEDPKASPTAFQELVALAKHWQEKPLEKKHAGKSWIGRVVPI